MLNVTSNRIRRYVYRMVLIDAIHHSSLCMASLHRITHSSLLITHSGVQLYSLLARIWVRIWEWVILVMYHTMGTMNTRSIRSVMQRWVEMCWRSIDSLTSGRCLYLQVQVVVVVIRMKINLYLPPLSPLSCLWPLIPIFLIWNISINCPHPMCPMYSVRFYIWAGLLCWMHTTWLDIICPALGLTGLGRSQGQWGLSWIARWFPSCWMKYMD